MPELLYRFLAPADRSLTAGDRFTLARGLPVTTDARQATRLWADEGVLALWCDEGCDTIPSGAAFTVAGMTTLQHHGASALDLELPVVVAVADGTGVGDDAVTRASLLIRLALASGDVPLDGRDYATPLPR